jgi:hypothetical protein
MVVTFNSQPLGFIKLVPLFNLGSHPIIETADCWLVPIKYPSGVELITKLNSRSLWVGVNFLDWVWKIFCAVIQWNNCDPTLTWVFTYNDSMQGRPKLFKKLCPDSTRNSRSKHHFLCLCKVLFSWYISNAPDLVCIHWERFVQTDSFRRLNWIWLFHSNPSWISVVTGPETLFWRALF